MCDLKNRACCDDSLLASVTSRIWCGSLSRNHLHQTLRIIKFGAQTDSTEFAGVGGRVCVQRLRMLDLAFAEAATSALLWEILSWWIDEEEPDGCAIIQAAMNAKNGLFWIRQEMQANLSQASRAC